MNAHQLNRLSVSQLRKQARETLGSKTWIASARKGTLIQTLLHHAETGQVLDHLPPDLSQPAGQATNGNGSAEHDLADMIRQIAGGAVNESKVRDIVTEALNTAGTIKAVVSDAQLQAAIEGRLQDLPPQVIKFTDTGNSVDVTGEHMMMPRLLKHGSRLTRTWIAGPAGSFKTSACERAAEVMGMQLFLAIPCATPYDVVGYKDAQGNVHDTPVSRFVRAECDACLTIDEIDGWGPLAQLAVNTILANGVAVLPDGQHDLTHGGKYRKWIVATANTWGLGADAEYVGRSKLDAAFLNRFDAKLYWGYDEALEERIAVAKAKGANDAISTEDAKRIVAKVFKARRYLQAKGIRLIVSPRQTFAAAIALADGDTEDQIFDEIILGAAKDAQRMDVKHHCGIGA